MTKRIEEIVSPGGGEDRHCPRTKPLFNTIPPLQREIMDSTNKASDDE